MILCSFCLPAARAGPEQRRRVAESVVAARRLRLPINHAPTPVWLCSSGWIRLAWDVAACGSVCRLGLGLTALLRRLVADFPCTCGSHACCLARLGSAASDPFDAAGRLTLMASTSSGSQRGQHQVPFGPLLLVEPIRCVFRPSFSFSVSDEIWTADLMNRRR